MPLHADATQALGRIPLDAPVDLLSASAHKLYGPKGVGCLVARGGALEPLLRGGPQERGRRAGTENVAAIAGFGVACELARKERASRAAEMARLRDRLWQRLRGLGARRNGAPHALLPNTLSAELPGVAGEALVQALDLEGVAVSQGSACASGSIEPSPVLLAMGRTPAQARASLRFSLGWGNDEAQIDAAAARLADLLLRVREAGAA